MSVGDIAFMTYDFGDLPMSPFPGLKSPINLHKNAEMETSFFDIDVIASVLRLRDICDLEMPRTVKETQLDNDCTAILGQPRRSTEPEVFLFPPPAHLLDNSCDSSLNLSNVTTETPSTSFASSSSVSLVSTIPSSAVSSHTSSLSLASSTSSSSSSGSDVTSARSIVTSAPMDVNRNSGYISSPDVFSPICVSTPNYILPSTTSRQTGPFSVTRIAPYQTTAPHRIRPVTANLDVTSSNDWHSDNSSMLANPSTCSLSGSCASVDTSSRTSPNTSPLTTTTGGTQQWERLTAEFHHCPYPTRKHKDRLAEILGMRTADITRWFKNARRRYRCAMRKETRDASNASFDDVMSSAV